MVEVATVVVEAMLPLQVEVLVTTRHTMIMTIMMNMDMKKEMPTEKILVTGKEIVTDPIEQIAEFMRGDVDDLWTDPEETVIETETEALIEIVIGAEVEMAGIGKIETLETGMIATKKDLTVIVQAVTVERVFGTEIAETIVVTELVKGG